MDNSENRSEDSNVYCNPCNTLFYTEKELLLHVEGDRGNIEWCSMEECYLHKMDESEGEDDYEMSRMHI
jgi:hypothetical protein